MNVSCVNKQSVSKFSADDSVVIPIFEDDPENISEINTFLSVFPKTLIDFLNKQSNIFKPKLHEKRVFYGRASDEPALIVFYGLGKRQDFNPAQLSELGGDLGALVKRHDLTQLYLFWSLNKTDLVSASSSFMQGYQMGSYSFSGYKTQSNDEQSSVLKKILIVTANNYKSSSDAELSMSQGIIIGDAVNKARDLANMPANMLTPKEFLNQAKSIKGLTITAIDEKKAKSLNMGGFLAVSQGSVEPGYMIVMEYKGASKSVPPIGLVGKGVTFDTGGISIKPSKGMFAMKGDMGGAAAVFATMQALTLLKPKCNVIAILGVVENMPSHIAYKPGDVIHMMNGKTVEVTNTDAEGRMVLADALHYICQKGVTSVVDMATLTGACSVALGDCASAIMGSDQGMIDQFISSSEKTGDRLWQLPLYEDYFLI